MMILYGGDFDPDKFLAALDAEKDASKKLQSITAVIVASMSILSDRAETNKYALFETVIMHSAMAIAVETKKEYALNTLKEITNLVKMYEPGTKH